MFPICCAWRIPPLDALTVNALLAELKAAHEVVAGGSCGAERNGRKGRSMGPRRPGSTAAGGMTEAARGRSHPWSTTVTTACGTPLPPPSRGCLAAEHCWDPVGLAIVEYAYRFERLRASAQGGG